MRAMPPDEVAVRLGWALRDGRLNGWESGFARRFLSIARRGGDPSAKQMACARRIVEAVTDPVIEQ